MKRAIIAVALVALALAGCGGHNTAWHNGYTYATDNAGNAQDVGVAGFTKADWCAIGRRYATAGPTGLGFIAGCVQGLTDSGIYGQ
ncbi:MAG TPA: hypothetical protein VMU94_25810 [Streptosporangiaceae bacterium]|nr:hypothetical protein [Streptosporangiaceae bacterium]